MFSYLHVLSHDIENKPGLDVCGLVHASKRRFCLNSYGEDPLGLVRRRMMHQNGGFYWGLLLLVACNNMP